MNLPPIQQGGPMGMGPMAQPTNPQMVPVQQAAQQGQPHVSQQSQEKMDNVSKAKQLMGPLRDSLAVALKSAAATLRQNGMIDIGTTKNIELQDHKFNKNLEDFYSICDQIELNLKTAIECSSQNSSSARYLPLHVQPTRMDSINSQDTMAYPQYLTTVRSQVQYVQDVHNLLLNAYRNVATNE